jgi:hypothetical protein
MHHQISTRTKSGSQSSIPSITILNRTQFSQLWMPVTAVAPAESENFVDYSINTSPMYRKSLFTLDLTNRRVRKCALKPLTVCVNRRLI